LTWRLAVDTAVVRVGGAQNASADLVVMVDNATADPMIDVLGLHGTKYGCGDRVPRGLHGADRGEGRSTGAWSQLDDDLWMSSSPGRGLGSGTSRSCMASASP
jgi:hypothetical protein